VRACPGNVNPNCVSTASLDENGAFPWRSTEADASTATAVLDAALLALFPEAQLLAARELPGVGLYRSWAMPGRNGGNTLEFLVKEEAAAGRSGWAGDAGGPLVTYRALARKVQYIGWISQPVGDTFMGASLAATRSRSVFASPGAAAARGWTSCCGAAPLLAQLCSVSRVLRALHRRCAHASPLKHAAARGSAAQIAAAGDERREQLTALRERLGWSVLGCELIECFAPGGAGTAGF